MWRAWILLGLFWCCAATGAIAQSGESGKRVALLIGNSAYGGGMPSLTYPSQDVTVLEQSFRRLGFEVQVVRNADQRNLARAIREFGNRAREAQVAMVYYSGHGMQAREENYLIPVGASIENEADLDIEAVPLRVLLRQIEDARPRTSLVILDACRDNPVAGRTKSGTKGLGRVLSPPSNTMVVFAAPPGTTATDNGVFARELARHVEQPNIGIRTVFDRVGQAVSQATNSRQTIQRDDQMTEDVVLLARPGEGRPPLGSTPASSDPERDIWEAIRGATTEGPLNAYLKEFPNGRYAPQVRILIANLRAQSAPQSAPMNGPKVLPRWIASQDGLLIQSVIVSSRLVGEEYEWTIEGNYPATNGKEASTAATDAQFWGAQHIGGNWVSLKSLEQNFRDTWAPGTGFAIKVRVPRAIAEGRDRFNLRLCVGNQSGCYPSPQLHPADYNAVIRN